MKQFLIEFYDKYSNGICLLTAICVVAVILTGLIVCMSKTNNRLMGECIKYHKEYECVMMLQGSYRICPNIIPTR